jgi:hypothetical protein
MAGNWLLFLERHGRTLSVTSLFICRVQMYNKKHVIKSTSSCGTVPLEGGDRRHLEGSSIDLRQKKKVCLLPPSCRSCSIGEYTMACNFTKLDIYIPRKHKKQFTHNMWIGLCQKRKASGMIKCNDNIMKANDELVCFQFIIKWYKCITNLSRVCHFHVFVFL